MIDKESILPQDKDPHLDIPAEANTDKHVNFRDDDQGNDDDASGSDDKVIEERRKQWQEGLEEGRRSRDNK